MYMLVISVFVSGVRYFFLGKAERTRLQGRVTSEELAFKSQKITGGPGTDPAQAWSLISAMTVSPLPLFVVVIGRAGTRSRSGADKCTFPAANQRSSTSTNGCANPDTLRSLLFSSLWISIVPALAARDGNGEREREH